MTRRLLTPSRAAGVPGNRGARGPCGGAYRRSRRCVTVHGRELAFRRWTHIPVWVEHPDCQARQVPEEQASHVPPGEGPARGLPLGLLEDRL